MGWIGETDSAKLELGALLTIAPDLDVEGEPSTHFEVGHALNIRYGLNRNMIAASIAAVRPDGITISVEDGSTWTLTRASEESQEWIVGSP